ncbi:MAG: hypothetical protein EOL97_07035 [Spirochaetia bacterium]|nr:hypothetical protein [Spirochaetia bacterium]
MEYCRQKDIQSKIGSIIQDAKKYIIIVSPYINLDSTYTALLEMSISKNIPVTFFYRKDNINDINDTFKDIERFEKLSGVTLYACSGLHAKIYMNEVDFLITSRNLYMKKGEESLDIGLFSNINESKEIYYKIKDDLELFAHTSFKNINTSTKSKNNDLNRFCLDKKGNNHFNPFKLNKTIELPTKNKKEDNYYNPFSFKKNENHYKQQKKDAYCIRCGEPIPFNPDKPYCSSCFSTWVQYEDITYPENYCHKCGKDENDISMQKSLCFPCWKEWQNSLRLPL